MKYSNKGYTLIEIIIVLGLLGILSTLIFSFFLLNLKIFDSQSNELELQHQIQSTMYYLLDNNMYANGIVQIKTKNGQVNLEKNNKAENVQQFQIDIPGNYNNIFNLTYHGNLRFNFGKGKSTSTEIANYIDCINLYAIENNFLNAKGISIEITFKKNTVEKTIKTNLYFRNSN